MTQTLDPDAVAELCAVEDPWASDEARSVPVGALCVMPSWTPESGAPCYWRPPRVRLLWRARYSDGREVFCWDWDGRIFTR